MKPVLIPALMLVSVLALAADRSVIRPRDSAGAYPVQSERPVGAVGAELLTADQVHGAFSSELNRAYMVVEIGLFPKGAVNVDHLDFTLVPSGSQSVVRPVAAETVARVLQKPAQEATRRASAPGDITIHPTVGIGYENRSPGYDPTTGRNRDRDRGGWVTSAGVGVGVGGSGEPGMPPPASTSADRRTMETELSEKSLPEGQTSKAVAGYLYFPFPGRRRDVAYDLIYSVDGEKFVLPLGRYAGKK